MADTVEKRLGELEESAKKKERRLSELETRLAGAREHIIMALEKEFDRASNNVNKECAETRRQMAELITMQQDRYNEILAEMNEVKNRIVGLTGVYGEVKDLVNATNRLIVEISEAMEDEGNAHIADMKAMISARMAGNEEEPLTAGELKELAEAANVLAEAEAKINNEKWKRRFTPSSTIIHQTPGCKIEF